MNSRAKKWNLFFCLALTILLVGGLFESSARARNRLQKKPTSKKVSVSQAINPLKEFEKTYSEAKSLEADITQEVYQATLDRTKTSKGSIKLAKPGFVRWDTLEPEMSVMVSNGRALWYYSPQAAGKEKGQAISQDPKEIQKQPLFRLMTGTKAIEPDFKQESSKALEKGGFEFKLSPVASMGDLKTVTLKVSEAYLIETVDLEYNSGNKTKIMLQNQKLNGKFPAEIFQFKPPAGTEVLHY